MRRFPSLGVIATAALLAACGGDDGAKPRGGKDAGKEPDSGSHDEGGAPDAAPAKRRVVTADWLNKSLSVLDYDALVGGAASRDDALVGTVDLSAYAPGPIEVALAPDGVTAVVTVGPGFFAGGIGAIIGATDVATDGTALIVDLEERSVVKEVKPPSPPMGVAITPDGHLAFTADHSGSTLSVIDLATKSLLASIEVGGSPEETSISPDGALGIVNTDSNGAVRFFDPTDPGTTLTEPFHVGGDPGGAAFFPELGKLVIGKSLSMGTETAGYAVLDVSNPRAPSILEAPAIANAVPYGMDRIPGTTRVLSTRGIASCGLDEIDVAASPSSVVRTIEFPCEKASLPMSTAIDAEGKHAFVAVPGDNSLVVVDLESGSATRIPWLSAAGPTDVAVTP